MILIADSGSTKTDWACVSGDRSRRITFTSQGYNPNYISQEEMCEDILRSLLAGFPREEVREIYFYGAGVTELQYGFVRSTLREVFPAAAEIFVAMDLLAAAAPCWDAGAVSPQSSEPGPTRVFMTENASRRTSTRWALSSATRAAEATSANS